jgi:hypothetical protein
MRILLESLQLLGFLFLVQAENGFGTREGGPNSNYESLKNYNIASNIKIDGETNTLQGMSGSEACRSSTCNLPLCCNLAKFSISADLWRGKNRCRYIMSK